jgi:hypothetical protein
VLLDNTEEALNNAQSEEYQGTVTAFPKFREGRQTFLADLAYILVAVWPKNDLPEYWTSNYGMRPEGFDDRLLAKRLLRLAKSYEWLLWGRGASSINCFAMNGKG